MKPESVVIVHLGKNHSLFQKVLIFPMFLVGIALDQYLITYVILIGGMCYVLTAVVLFYHAWFMHFDILSICFEIDIEKVVPTKH